MSEKCWRVLEGRGAFYEEKNEKETHFREREIWDKVGK